MAVKHLYLEREGNQHLAGIDVSHLESAWPRVKEGGFPLLQGLDPHGNTVFNRLQAFGLEEELARIRSGLSDAGQRATLDSAIDLARRCQRGERLYLRFAAD